MSRAIENAQRRVEAHNFEIRKHLLEYDNVMNQQREVIYSQRREVLAGQDLKQSVQEMIEEQVGRNRRSLRGREGPSGGLGPARDFRMPSMNSSLSGWTPPSLERTV